jgi:p-hydroxybenzoate 3-monooxygenase
MAAISAEVVVVGAGPAGLTLANRLRQEGIDCLVLEQASREAVVSTPRAGFLEEWAVRALEACGLASKALSAEAPRHGSVEFRFEGERRVLDYARLTGHHHVVYPQQSLVRDLLERFESDGGEVRFGVRGLRLHGATEGPRPTVAWTEPESGHPEAAHTAECAFVAGCDGARGVSRDALVAAGASLVRHQYGVDWLAMLARTPPTADTVIMGIHPRGFAAHMPRGPEVTRFYLQVPRGTSAEEWTDEHAWIELQARLAVPEPGHRLASGPLLEKRVLELHDYLVRPMSVGRLQLAGDSAHLVAPIGAKGMNLAIHDALRLARGYAAVLRGGDEAPLAGYSDRSLQQAWDYLEFSEWLAEVYHGSAAGGFRAGAATARLRRIFASDTAARAFAEMYLGVRTTV